MTTFDYCLVGIVTWVWLYVAVRLASTAYFEARYYFISRIAANAKGTDNGKD